MKSRRSIRTDLASESHEFYCRENNCSEIPGVQTEFSEDGEIKITKVRVTNQEGEKIIGKPIGEYVTIDVPFHFNNSKETFRNACRILSEQLRSIISLNDDDTVLVVGLGNSHITSDSLGPKVVSSVLITRHMLEMLPEDMDEGIRPVCGIIPGVLGITGIETIEIIQGVTEKIKPKAIIAIDALASRKMERVSTTIQISNTGISPGSGIGNNRKSINRESLGIPVIAIGVPTVIDAANIANDTIDLIIDLLISKSEGHSDFYNMLKQLDTQEKYEIIRDAVSPGSFGNLIVTPKEIDEIIEEVSLMIANGINISLHRSIGIDDISLIN